MKVSSLLFNCLFAFIFHLCSSYCICCVKSLTPFLIEALPNPSRVIFTLTEKISKQNYNICSRKLKEKNSGYQLEQHWGGLTKNSITVNQKTNLFHIHYSQWRGQINKKDHFLANSHQLFFLHPLYLGSSLFFFFKFLFWSSHATQSNKAFGDNGQLWIQEIG